MTNLELLIKSHQQRSVPASDWHARKEKWLDELSKLMVGIREQLLSAGVANENIRYIDFTLNEEYLGQYNAIGLSIRIGPSEIVFEPKGSRIIGAFGRVDIVGPRGRAKLIADVDVDEDGEQAPLAREWRWYVYPAQGREGHFLLTQETLARLLTLVIE